MSDTTNEAEKFFQEKIERLPINIVRHIEEYACLYHAQKLSEAKVLFPKEEIEARMPSAILDGKLFGAHWMYEQVESIIAQQQAEIEESCEMIGHYETANIAQLDEIERLSDMNKSHENYIERLKKLIADEYDKSQSMFTRDEVEAFCKKQREICSYKWYDTEINQRTPEIILNAPTPEITKPKPE